MLDLHHAVRAGAGDDARLSPDFDRPREQRRWGYQEAMAAAGLETSFLIVDSENSRRAEEAMTEYISRKGAPEAVFAFTDAYAIGSAQAILSAGRQIPSDCLVWGFGDYPEGESFRVPLSTLRVPIEPIVEEAWRRLMARIADPSLPSDLELFPMELVERESSLRS